jgi:hypothetical protein
MVRWVATATLIVSLCLHAQSKDPNEVLKLAQAKLLGTGHDLRQYTCLQTIERSYYSDPARKPTKDSIPAASCEGREFNKNGHLTLESADRLRLQVAVSDGKEISSWAAASRFDSRSVFELVTTGAVGTGAFGTALVDIFENSGTRFTLVRRASEGQGEAFEYTFEVPFLASNWSVMASRVRTITAYGGSFAIDANSAELKRVTSETDELKPETNMCRVRTINDYHYLAIGDGRYLVPYRAELDTVTPNGSETRNVTTFSDCHEYRGVDRDVRRRILIGKCGCGVEG